MEALCGAETGDFARWGMTMVVAEYSLLDGQVWTVRRVRASLRAGEVSMKELLDKLGVLKGLSGTAISVETRKIAV